MHKYIGNNITEYDLRPNWIKIVAVTTTTNVKLINKQGVRK